MSLVGTFDKDAAEHEPYEIDLSKVLEGEAIKSVEWTSSNPFELPIDQPIVRGNTIGTWVAGGEPGSFYTVTAYVQTSKGRSIARGFGVRVTDDHALAGRGFGTITPVTSEPTAVDLAIQTAGQTAILVPALWLAGKTFRIKDLNGWRLVGISLSVSSALTLGLLLINHWRKS